MANYKGGPDRPQAEQEQGWMDWLGEKVVDTIGTENATAWDKWIQDTTGWSLSDDPESTQAIQEIAQEIENTHGPEARDEYFKFLDKAHGNDSLQKILNNENSEQSLGESLKQLHEQVGGHADSYSTMNDILADSNVQTLIDMAADDPELQGAISEMIGAGGDADYQDLKELQTALGENREIIAEMLADPEQRAALIEDFKDKPQDFMQDLQKVAAHQAELSKIEGFNDFKNHIENNPDLQHLTGIDGSLDLDKLEQSLPGIVEMAEQNPDIFTNLNTILEADGADEFLQSLAEVDNTQGLLAPGQVGGATGFVNQLGDMLEENPKLFEEINTKFDDQQLQGFVDLYNVNPEAAMGSVNLWTAHGEDFETFTNYMEGTLGEQMLALFGPGGEDAGTLTEQKAEFIQKVADAAEKHPDIFENANEIFGNEKFQSLIGRMSENELIKEQLGNAVGQEMTADGLAYLVKGLHDRVANREGYLDDAHSLLDTIEEKPEMVKWGMEKLGGTSMFSSGKADPLSILDQGIEMNESYGNLMSGNLFGMLVSDDLAQTLENFLGADFMAGIKGMFQQMGQIVQGFVEGIENHVTSNPDASLLSAVTGADPDMDITETLEKGLDNMGLTFS